MGTAMGAIAFTRPTRLEEGMALAGFSSGQPFVDRWLATRAAKARQRGSAVVYVSHRAGADASEEPPAGFYTLSSGSVARDLVDGGWLKRNAPNEIPVILLGVLGVDSRYQGNGLGRMLLHDASTRAMAVADGIGAKALIVDPIDADAAIFYSSNGFEWVPGLNRMFAPLKLT